MTFLYFNSKSVNRSVQKGCYLVLFSLILNLPASENEPIHGIHVSCAYLKNDAK